jgi:hypothetical protein
MGEKKEKLYKMIGAASFQVDPPYGTWIPPGFGLFRETIDPGREALLVRYGVIEVVPEPEPKADPKQEKKS